MNKFLSFCFAFYFLIFSIAAYATPAEKTDFKIKFWATQQKGANVFNKEIDRKNIVDARNYGITFIRLVPDKFITKNRDFLIGDADEYSGLVKNDLARLIEILSICEEEGMKIVLSMLSLPGSRWKQNNSDVDDLRIWQDIDFQMQAAKFWHNLAKELKEHSAVVGYNILNEPHPERLYSTDAKSINDIKQDAVQQYLFDFYNVIVDSIRQVDDETPIILDSSAYSDPKTFEKLQIIDDEKVIYSFHMYEPYKYTNKRLNNGVFEYPDQIDGAYWDKRALEDYMSSVVKFQIKNNVPSNRILVGEFGCYRMSRGIENYFKDLTEIFNANSWHYAFYAFREDIWDGMDYELGNTKVPWNYWQAIERGEIPKVKRSGESKAFRAIIDSF